MCLLKKVSYIILILCFSLIIVSCGESDIQRNAQKLGLSIPKDVLPATDIRFNTIDGDVVKLCDYRGKVIFLNLWASWCVPCGMEMPSIERLHKKFGHSDVQVIALNIENSITKDNLIDYATKGGYSFMLGHDTFKDAQKSYFTGSTPITYIIGRDFNIKGRLLGTSDWYSKPAIDLISALIR